MSVISAQEIRAAAINPVNEANLSSVLVALDREVFGLDRMPVAVTPPSVDAPWWKSKEVSVPVTIGGEPLPRSGACRGRTSSSCWLHSGLRRFPVVA
ncbi:hypothetical protein [Rhizobium mongolense]|uniref:Uncharacterized protein n=1 Tax=Rhizobium mongolense TaxID=57676 RepID=A0ABR6IV37_9HYPH|nr:hypothetical protein [Rhizobium mongolense]MBB4231774.1 hypothetical protein [Rhizobium mongolense]